MLLRAISDDQDKQEWEYEFDGLRLRTDGLSYEEADRVIPLGEACWRPSVPSGAPRRSASGRRLEPRCHASSACSRAK